MKRFSGLLSAVALAAGLALGPAKAARAALETPAAHPHIGTQAQLRSGFFQLHFREETFQ